MKTRLDILRTSGWNRLLMPYTSHHCPQQQTAQTCVDNEVPAFFSNSLFVEYHVSNGGLLRWLLSFVYDVPARLNISIDREDKRVSDICHRYNIKHNVSRIGIHSLRQVGEVVHTKIENRKKKRREIPPHLTKRIDFNPRNVVLYLF
ncbi:hypothetical protein J6590_054424 [Homalodisca vitripennis]|nr:hypothetical protein J6590_054424 [Homalodisca vitripennis]